MITKMLTTHPEFQRSNILLGAAPEFLYQITIAFGHVTTHSYWISSVRARKIIGQEV